MFTTSALGATENRDQVFRDYNQEAVLNRERHSHVPGLTFVPF